MGSLGGKAIIADEAAHDGAVFLLDVRAVVFLPGATAGEGDRVPPAIGQPVLIDELGAVVAVQADERHRQELAHAMNGAAHAVLALAPDGLQLDPAGGDINGAESTEVEALGAAAAVGDQVDLEETGASIVPLGEGTNGNLVLEARARP